MSNYKTGAQRYNDRMDKIWEKARQTGDVGERKWNEIKTGSKITLERDTILKSFNNEVRAIKAGDYYIVGFWADICKISKNFEDVYGGLDGEAIQSIELKAFKNII